MAKTRHKPAPMGVVAIRLLCFSVTLRVACSPALSGTLSAAFGSGSDVPITAASYTADANSVILALNFAPPTGTELKVIKNTGPDFIHGTFDNLTNGQPVALSYGGVGYSFIADYYGGSGNDLVLSWADSYPFGWGWDVSGQLGGGTNAIMRGLPMPVFGTSALAGKPVLRLSAGDSYTLACCSDGTAVAWGYNGYGQLGNGTSADSNIPVAVNAEPGSALDGKTVVAVAAGWRHSLALCSDGSVAAWGCNDHGQLGDNTTLTRYIPVRVNADAGSALYGKKAVAIAAGLLHSLAACSDGTVVAWGNNWYGQLGDGTTTERLLPTAVNTNASLSALHGRTVVGIAAGGHHNLAMCADGTVVGWGDDTQGQLGDNSDFTHRLTPVSVNTDAGLSALSGKTVAAITAGMSHSLALCSDGTVAGWGDDTDGAVGDNTDPSPPWLTVPTPVCTTPGVSALSDKSVVAIAVGMYYSLALCSDGTTTAWGDNTWGQLGDNTTTNRPAPVAVGTSTLGTGQRFTHIFCGPVARHNFGFVASPLPVSPIVLSNFILTNGSFQFFFTNVPGGAFTVLAAANVALPTSAWDRIGSPLEISPGRFQFTDPIPLGQSRRFYRVSSP